MDWTTFLGAIALINSVILLFLIGVILHNLKIAKSGLLYLTYSISLLLSIITEDPNTDPREMVNEYLENTLKNKSESE